MSAFIGTVKAPHNNSPHDGAEVWCSVGDVELHIVYPGQTIAQHFDPIAARNLAALLVRASEEVERMRARARAEETPIRPGEEA